MTKEKMSDIIERLRGERGWSQEKLAEMAGLGYHTVFRAEAGNEIAVKSVMKIAKALGVAPSALINETSSRQSESEISKSDLILEIQSRLTALDYDELRTVLSAIDDLSMGSPANSKTTRAD